MNTYPKEFKNQVYIVAFGVEGLIDSEVYDAHEAFEIDKTKMKMLVPLDMNGKKILNTNYDLKFGDLFKIIKCYTSSFFNDGTFFCIKKVIKEYLDLPFQLLHIQLIYINIEILIQIHIYRLEN